MVMSEKILQVAYHGPFRDAGGYAKMNREIVRSLCRHGVSVKTYIMPSVSNSATLNVKDIEALSGNIIDKKCCYVYGCLPQGYPSTGYARNIIYTMMETETVAKSFVNKVNNLDEIWVPTQWNVDSFQSAGVKRPIYKMPLGVDVDLYRPDVQPRIILDNENNPISGKFVFFSLFGWSLRKGPDVLIKAFLRAFGESKDVVLLISSRIWGNDSKANQNTIRSEIAMYKKNEGFPNAQNIVFFPDVLSEEELPSLFAASNCFVLPSRGEGFGLPWLEAGACQIPVVGTRHGGQLEFLDDEVAYLIEPEGVEDCKRLKLGLISSYYKDGALVAKLGDKAINQLSEVMKHIYANYEEAKDKACKFRVKLERNYTWNAAAGRIIARLNEISMK